jgi:hypothetical protein
MNSLYTLQILDGGVGTREPVPQGALEYTVHLGETRHYISADVHARVLTSAIIQYYIMQWPKTVLVFLPFPTQGPDPHAIATSYVYTSYFPCIYSMQGAHYLRKK